MFVFDGSEPARMEVTIELKAGSFVLFLDPPSVEEAAHDDGLTMLAFGSDSSPAFARRFMRRLNRVVGWDGVQNAQNEPVAFSQEALQRLLAKVPAVMTQLATAFARLYSLEDRTLGEPDASGKSSQSTPTASVPA